MHSEQSTGGPCDRCSRRVAARHLLVAGTAAWAAPLLAACRDTAAITTPTDGVADVDATITTTDVVIDLARSPALARDGAVIIGRAALIVVRSGTAFSAFSNVCPHAGCGVSEIASDRVRCRCHGSEFALDGRVLQGPADAPLRALAVSRRGDLLTITRGL